MQNITLHPTTPTTKPYPKRSVQSLIDDSAIDNQPSVVNFQLLQMKKAYNETYKSFNTKLQSLEGEINKYKEKCKKLEEANVGLAKRCMELEERTTEYNQMKLYCEKMKRKVAYIEGKYESLRENRELAKRAETEQYYGNNAPNHAQGQPAYDQWILGRNDQNKQSFADKNEIYKEISDLISAKVKTFTKQIRVHSMTRDLQTKIQTFLQELIYITPVSGIDGVKFLGVKEKEVGKLTTSKEHENQVLLSEQKAWKELSRSVEKFREGEDNMATVQRKKQTIFNQEQSNRKAGTRGRSPLSMYNNQGLERTPEYRPSPKKVKIFLDS